MSHLSLGCISHLGNSPTFGEGGKKKVINVPSHSNQVNLMSLLPAKPGGTIFVPTELRP